MPWLRFGSIAVGLFSLLGCAAASEAPFDAAPAIAPHDLAIEVFVLPGREAAGANRTPLHVILMPDGALHYAASASHAMPPWRRTLSQSQLQSVWSRARALTGLGESIACPLSEAMLPDHDEIIYAIEITGEDVRRTVAQRATTGAEIDPAITALVDVLAELAWAHEPVETLTRRIPKRYDFGPDPYARYRGQSGDQ